MAIPQLRTKMQSSTDPAQQARLKQRIQFMRRKNAPGLNSGMAANTPNKALKGLTGRMEGVTDPTQRARMETRANYIRSRSGMPRVATPGDPTTPVAPPPPTPPGADPTTPTPATPAVDPAAQDMQANALFPSGEAMLPEYYQGSPLYKFRMDEANKEADRWAASRGLLGSGAEWEARQRAGVQIGAEETNTARAIAQQEANRLAQLQENEANRLERRGDATWGRNMDMLNFLGAQNPINNGLAAAGAGGDILSQIGATRGNYFRDAYGRVSGGGGGGGGVSMPQFIPPYPSSPNYSASDYAGINGDQSFYQDILGTIGSTVGMAAILGF